MTPDLPIPEEAAKPKWADLFGIDPSYTDDPVYADYAVPDLPVSPETLAAVAEAIDENYDEDAYLPVYSAAGRCVSSQAAVAAINALVPHLRSLQVETQVEYGRALGRKAPCMTVLAAGSADRTPIRSR